MPKKHHNPKPFAKGHPKYASKFSTAELETRRILLAGINENRLTKDSAISALKELERLGVKDPEIAILLKHLINENLLKDASLLEATRWVADIRAREKAKKEKRQTPAQVPAAQKLTDWLSAYEQDKQAHESKPISVTPAVILPTYVPAISTPAPSAGARPEQAAPIATQPVQALTHDQRVRQYLSELRNVVPDDPSAEVRDISNKSWHKAK